jgi:radical SAM protein with 4Fe4S-binding SPASM domain
MLYDNFINNDPVIFKNRIEIETYLLKKFNKGLEIKPMYKENACMIDSNKSVVINPLGNFSLCEHMVDNNIVGNIYAGILDQNEVNKYKEKRFIKNVCEKCIFYPLCISPIYCQLSNNCNLQRMELNKEYIKLCLYVKLKCYIKRK